jgi:hypothetical protein
VRVWSTDWFDNPSKETDKLVAKLEQLRMRPVSEMPSYPSLHRASAIVDPEAVEKAAKATSEEAPPAREPTLEVVKPAPLPSQAKPAFDGTALLKGTGKLTPAQAVAALEAYRDIVIAPASANWEPERSLLRPAMMRHLYSSGSLIRTSGTPTSPSSCGKAPMGLRRSVTWKMFALFSSGYSLVASGSRRPKARPCCRRGGLIPRGHRRRLPRRGLG